MDKKFKLYGRVTITGYIVAKTGLHIGGSGASFEIGGVDNPVIKDLLTGQPYIPGSSLRGKMRSLTEKSRGTVKGQPIGQSVEIHTCKTPEKYESCPICNIYGVSADNASRPTRLIVRDVMLTTDSASHLHNARTTLPYTEVKKEVSIDRVTSQAAPRDVERVPAGAVFGPAEFVYSIYESQDVDWLTVLLDGMELLQDDYLGGMGSRGSGKIEFANLSVQLKRASAYRQPETLGDYATLSDLSQNIDTIIANIHTALKREG